MIVWTYINIWVSLIIVNTHVHSHTQGTKATYTNIYTNSINYGGRQLTIGLLCMLPLCACKNVSIYVSSTFQDVYPFMFFYVKYMFTCTWNKFLTANKYHAKLCRYDKKLPCTYLPYYLDILTCTSHII